MTSSIAKRFFSLLGIGNDRKPKQAGHEPTFRPGFTVPHDENMHYNEVLASEAAIQECVDLLSWEHHTYPKTWDFYKTAHFIDTHIADKEANLLDMGCVGSPILEYLYGRGYSNLYGSDYSDIGIPEVPILHYWKGDISSTPYDDAFFSAITCISVVEHGLDLGKFFKECSRILEDNGHLLISTDYYDPKVSTSDVPISETFNLPWVIFDRKLTEELIEIAQDHDLHLIEPVNWESVDPAVHWGGKDYSFIYLAFKRGTRCESQ